VSPLRSSITPLTGALILAAAAVLLLHVWPAMALETDQYIAWGRPLADSTEVLDAWFNLRLEKIVREANAKETLPDCWDMAVAMERSLRKVVVLHTPDDFAENSALVARIPDSEEEELNYWKNSIYGDSPPLAPAKLMPLSSTIEAGGVRFGADKLAHFVSVGWLYFKDLHGLAERGVPVDQAMDEVIRKGIDGELLYLLGYRVSGIFSIPDLEADYQGMLFYRDLCGGPDPVLVLREGRWTIRRPIGLGRYITPEWDESYEPMVISPGRWKGIRPQLAELCPKLGEPWLRDLWARYEEHDTLTPTEQIVLDLVAEGRLPDPRQFTVRSVCGLPPHSFGQEIPRAAPAPRPAAVPREAMEQVARDEAHVRHRTLFGWQAGWHEPMGPTASVALFQTAIPAGSDCHLSCFMSGFLSKLTAGPGGGELSLGWATTSSRIGRSGRSLNATWLGFSARGALLRTWRPYSTWRANRTYAGVEVEASIARFGMTLGAMRRVAGGPNDHLICLLAPIIWRCEMAQVNSKRVLLGGLAGGVAWILWSGIVNVVILGSRYQAIQEIGGLLKKPRYPFFLPVYFLSLLLIGYVLAWLYAGLRETYGAGPRTALAIGILIGFAVAFPLNFSTAAWAPIPRIFPLWWMIEFGIGAILAALIAGWLYRD